MMSASSENVGSSHKFQFMQGINNCDIVQCYDERKTLKKLQLETAGNKLDDLDQVLSFYRRKQEKRNVVVVFPDLEEEAGVVIQSRFQAILEMHNIKMIICIGQNAKEATQKFSMFRKYTFKTAEDFSTEKMHDLLENRIVILWNTDHSVMKNVAQRLRLHSDRATLHIDTDAMKHNIEYYRRKMPPNTKVCAVLKASSYGMGYKVSEILEEYVDYFAVACTVEGIQMRRMGITKPILVFNPRVESFDNMIHYQLEPTIFTIDMLEKLNSIAERENKAVNIHLELETGFNRHGFTSDQLDNLILLLRSTSQICVKGIFSHLTSEEENQLMQGKKFKMMSTKIEEELGISAIKHLLSTGELHTLPQFFFDMVRIGGGLYGFSAPQVEKHLRKAVKMTSSISQVIRVKRGECISYARDGDIFTAPKDMDVAVVDFGYVDVYRHQHGAQSAGNLHINSFCVPSVGRVCMDMTMVDVTGVPVQVGDEVTVFGGDGQSLREFCGGMLRGEVIAKIHERVDRVIYVNSLRIDEVINDCRGRIWTQPYNYELRMS